jgi:hypothetical protein
MFRFLSLIAFFMTLGWLVHALRSNSIGFASAASRVSRAVKNIFVSFAHLRSLSSKDFSNRLLFPLTLVFILILALTGFLPQIILGNHMSGYLLVLHIVAGPPFSLCMVTIGLLWADKHRFDKNDWAALKTLPSKRSKTRKKRAINLWQKVCFWLIMMLALSIIFSIVSSMYKILGMHGQEFFLQLHRYSALFIVILTIIYTYIVKVLKLSI